MPLPTPTTTPQSSTSCQISVISSEPARPAMMKSRAVTTTRRRPKRFMNAAANGPMKPKRRRRSASAKEMSAVCQPNSFCSGTIMNPGSTQGAGRGEHGEEGRSRDDPAVMDVSPGKPGGEAEGHGEDLLSHGYLPVF